MEKITFETSLNRWLTANCLGRKPTTQRFYRYVVKNIRENWHDINQPCDDITPDNVLSFAQDVDCCSPSMWNGIVSALKAITPHASILKRRAMRSRALVPPGQSQFTGLLDECDASERSKAGLVVRFLALTGLRISEARGLKWQNLKADCIELPPELTKNNKPRSIPLLAGTGDVLNRLKVLGDGQYVLPRQNPRKALENACIRAGLPRMSPHVFRHMFATRCIESGVDIPTVARWLGHQDGGALLSKTYFHLLDDHSRNMAKRVEIRV